MGMELCRVRDWGRKGSKKREELKGETLGKGGAKLG